MEYCDPRAFHWTEIDKNALSHYFELFVKTSRETRCLWLLNRWSDGTRPQPAVTREISVGQLRSVVWNESVGYVGTSIARASGHLMEFGDRNTGGYSTTLGYRGRGIIEGRSAPDVGRVGRNIPMVDVTGIPGVSMCQETPADEIAVSSVTIDDELLARLSPGKAPLAV